MSKAAKARKHIEKMKEKRRVKDAKRALYASMRGTSRKHKKIEAKSRFGGWTITRHRHLMLICGNPACKKCGYGAKV